MVLKKTPHVIVLQEDSQDCAPACLATICKYYNVRIPLNILRELLKTDLRGTFGDKIVEGATKLGFTCYAAVSNEKSFPEKGHFPFIAHINQNQSEHYVVVFEIKNKTVILGDPAEGLVKMKLEDFKNLWSGVFFVLIKKENLKQSDKEKSSLTRFAYVLKPFKRIIVEIFIASVLLSIFGIISAFYFRFLVDNVLYSGVRKTLHSVSIGYLIVIIFQLILNISRNQLILSIGVKIEATLNFEFFEHVLNLPLGFFNTRKTGEILSRINDIHSIRQMLSTTGINVLLDSLMLVIGAVFLITQGGILTLIAIVPVLISAVIALIYIKPYKRMIRQKAIIDADKYSSMVESVNGISTVKALASETFAFERTEIKMVDSAHASMKIGTSSNIVNSVQTFLNQVGNLSVYWIGGLFILNGSLSLGKLIAFSILSGYFLGPLGRLLTLQPTIQEAMICASRLQNIMEEKCENELDLGNVKPKDTIACEISIKDLSFSYTGDKNAIENINIKIKAGSKVAFVGYSGSGKSTVVKLLMKFYNFNEGEILIDGINIKDYEINNYRKLVGYVPQEVLLFSGSIKENIMWGNDLISDQDVYAAASAVNADSFINKLPFRYETIIGERGASLSGGERQRVALARILLRKPKLIILDEATASLDAVTEMSIMNNLHELTKNITTIIVAHKLATITNCDMIYVFDDGKIIEQGKHDALIKQGGLYSALWQAQKDII